MGYHIGRACLEGHGVDSIVDEAIIEPLSAFEFNRPQESATAAERFCSKCGAETITECPSCQAPIRGAFEGVICASEWIPKPFCYHCGEPYPWTRSRVKAAEELLNELDELYDDEREKLKASLPELMCTEGTPKTESVVLRWKKVLARVAPKPREILTGLIVSVGSEFINHKFGMGSE